MNKRLLHTLLHHLLRIHHHRRLRRPRFPIRRPRSMFPIPSRQPLRLRAQLPEIRVEVDLREGMSRGRCYRVTGLAVQWDRGLAGRWSRGGVCAGTACRGGSARLRDWGRRHREAEGNAAVCDYCTLYIPHRTYAILMGPASCRGSGDCFLVVLFSPQSHTAQCRCLLGYIN